MSKNVTLQITFSAAVERLYQSIALPDGPSQWWTRFCETSGSVGGVSKFRFPKAGFFANMEITALIENQLVEWKCVDARHPRDAPFRDLRDWVGTRIRFECEHVDSVTSRLRMQHVGITKEIDCYQSCQSGWSHFLGVSLRSLLENGQGLPYTDDSENNI